MKISVNQNPYYAVKSYHISPDLHTNRNCRISAQSSFSFMAMRRYLKRYFCADHVHLKHWRFPLCCLACNKTDHLYMKMLWGKSKRYGSRARREVGPICDLSAGPVMYGCGAGRPQSGLCVAAHCAMAFRALQPPVPPYRYPAARHRALLIYCYTGFHN